MGAMNMWKKFIVGLISICCMGAAAFVGGALFASGTSTLRIQDNEAGYHYINETFSYTVSSDQNDEKVQSIEGGELHGNKETFTIPMAEKDTFEIKELKRPGAYSGEVIVQVTDADGSNPKEMKGNLSFILFGKAFQKEHLIMTADETQQLNIYGDLPDTIHPIVSYASADPSIAQTDEKGNVKAIQEGQTELFVYVYDQIQDDDHLLSQSSCTIEVLKQENEAVTFEDAIKEHSYRFYQSDSVYANKEKEQKIGMIDLGNSGEHTYFVEENKQDLYEVRDGIVYSKKEDKEGKKSVLIYVLFQDTHQLYQVEVNYEVQKEGQLEKSSFVFRYDGTIVSKIIREFQEGKNAFQISSNKNMEEVSFRLKNESDSQYLTISETGNVTVKKVTSDPVIIEALWNKEAYELPIIIQKASQRIYTQSYDLNVNEDDGYFSPVIEGRKGSGALSASTLEECVEVKTLADGTLAIQPIKAGTATIDVYNSGDDNYKNSNVITLHVTVAPSNDESGYVQADMKQLHIDGIEGSNGWYTTPIHVSLAENTFIGIQYQGKQRETFTLNENGEHSIPISLIDEQGKQSLPMKFTAKIDTHAPMIVSINERNAADTAIKRILDSVTFQSMYGAGKIIEIQATDALINQDIQNSEVGKIVYQVYQVNNQKETLIEEGTIHNQDQASIYIEDRQSHKICAYAQDNAGLIGEQRCINAASEDTLIPLTAKDSGIIMRSSDFKEDDDIRVLAATSKEIAAFSEAMKDISANEVIAYQFDWSGQNERTISAVEVSVPMVKDSTHGTWYQKQSDQTYQKIDAQQQGDTQILHLQNLQEVFYVNDDDKVLQHMQLKNTVQDTDVQNDASNVSAFVLKPIDLNKEDWKIFLYAAVALGIGLFIILLIRSGKEEIE